MATETPTTKNTSGSSRPGGSPRSGGAGARSGGPRRGGEGRGSRANFDRPKPEFDQKMLSIRRVTRVVSGGRRMSFAVSIVIGDHKGSVGLGTGKSSDTSLAINKAVRSARKHMIKIKTTKTMSIPHQVQAKFGSARIMIMPNRGKGLVSGSATRTILNLAGLKDVTSKVISGSKNQLNNARATMLALSEIATKRGATVIPVEIKEEVKEKE